MAEKKELKKPTPKELAAMIRDYSANGSRTITILSETMKPLRDFIVTYVSEESGGYVAGHLKDQRRIITMKFADIKEIRI